MKPRTAGNLPDWTKKKTTNFQCDFLVICSPGSRRYPEVAGAGVEDDIESLSWSAECNFPVILSLNTKILIKPFQCW